MSFAPYLYQAECLERLTAVRRSGADRALVVMASGLGKTAIAAFDAREWLTAQGGRLLYLCHRNEILAQARRTFEAILGDRYRYGYFQGEEKDISRADCIFGSFQTFRSWRHFFRRDEFSYIVVDESHHGPAQTYRPTLEYFQPQFLLGITATPDRTDLADIREIYGEAVFSLPLEDALVGGLLTAVSYYLLTDELKNLDALGRENLSLKDLNEKIFIPRRDEEIVRIITEHMADLPQPRVIIFCRSVRHANHLSSLFPRSLPIHYRIPPERQRMRLEAFRTGKANVILTIDKFNEGVDIPEANLIVFLRSTASRTIFLQQLGRGLRQAPGKDRVTVLDFVNNCERLEMVHHLWQTVEDRRPNAAVTREEDGETVTILDVNRVQFTKAIRPILDILALIRGGYTREVLIAQLQALGRELGRTPTSDDVQSASALGKCAYTSTMARSFGSFPDALEAAGFETRPHSYGRERLLGQLRALGARLERTPTSEDVVAARRTGRKGSIAHPGTFRREFGSFTAALRTAGLRIEFQQYDRDALIQILQGITKELGRPPSWRELRAGSRTGGCPHPGTFRNAFGSLRAALTAANATRDIPPT